MAPARLIRLEMASSEEWGAFVAVNTTFTEGIGRTPRKGFTFSKKNPRLSELNMHRSKASARKHRRPKDQQAIKGRVRDVPERRVLKSRCVCC